MQIKIVSPLSDRSEIDDLIQNGADEVYFGILPNQWQKEYKSSISTNRREFKSSNLTSFKDIEEITTICSKQNIKTSLTLNAHYYTDHQLEQIINLLKKVAVDNVIIADISLLEVIQKQFPHINIHISTGGVVFNAETVAFYKSLGAKRIIFPRHVLIDEFKEIYSAIPDMEYELFILNQGCINIDGFCYYMHGLRDSDDKPKEKTKSKLFSYLPENVKRNIRLNMEIGNGNACLQTYKITQGSHSEIKPYNPHVYCGMKCGVCSLYDVKNIPLHIKIVGREHPQKKKIMDVLFLKSVLKFLEKPLSREEYVRACKKLQFETYGEKCNALKCYY